MDDTTRNLMMKARKGATAQFGVKQWKLVLEALGFAVTLGKERTTVVSFGAGRASGGFAVTKEAGYRCITFYRMTDLLKSVGCDLVAESCAALGLPTLEAEKHAKRLAAGANDLHRTGTCQCCFNPQKVSKGDGKLMSLHGYTRPGHGYIVGDCMGQGHQPFEVSCEMTKLIRSHVEELRASNREWLGQLVRDEVESLPANVPTNERENDRYGYPRTKMARVDVARGAAAVQNPHKPECPWEQVPSFEDLRDREIGATERRIAQMTAHIDFLTEKITTWVRVWES